MSDLSGKMIAINGASGKLGRHLVPRLEARGAKLKLFSRDARKLEGIGSATEKYALDELEIELPGCDVLIDLAVRNNDQPGEDTAFLEDNFRRPQRLVQMAQAAGVGVTIFLSSFHALEPDNGSAYAKSKRALFEWIDQRDDDRVRQLVVPKITVAPAGSASSILWHWLSALKPVATLDEVERSILLLIQDPRQRTLIAGGTPEEHLPYRIANFIIDMGFVLAVLLLAGWLMLIFALLIRLDSKGPAIFAQERVGRDEKPFTLYKFRTMSLGTKQAGTHEVSAASVTRIGKTMRRFKIDELPQIINIVRRELSVVGPRPCLPVQRQLVEARRKKAVFEVRPGLTGLAQVRGIDMSDPDRLAHWDSLYASLRGAMLDVAIIWQTFIGRGGGDRVSH